MSDARQPLSLASMGWFFVGGAMRPDIEGQPVVGQMYVEFLLPAEQHHPFPVVMVHGGLQTGTNFTGTPDGREGWAQYFVRRGYAVYVVDQVARGRSAHWNQLHGNVNDSGYGSVRLVENRFTAPAAYGSWPQAKLHTQFPGTGRAPDPAFLQFYASQFPSLSDYPKQQELNRDALVALLDRIGPAILMTHSQSGAFGWPVADMRPELVKAIVALEPNGPPVHAIIDGQSGPAEWYRDDPAQKPYGLTVVPLTYDPPVTPDAPLRFERQGVPDGPGLVRCWKQAEPSSPTVSAQRNSDRHFRVRGELSRCLRSLHRGIPFASRRRARLHPVGRPKHPRQRAHDDDREEQRRDRPGRRRVVGGQAGPFAQPVSASRPQQYGPDCVGPPNLSPSAMRGSAASGKQITPVGSGAISRPALRLHLGRRSLPAGPYGCESRLMTIHRTAQMHGPISCTTSSAQSRVRGPAELFILWVPHIQQNANLILHEDVNI